MYQTTPAHNIIIQFLACVFSFIAAIIPAFFVAGFIASIIGVSGEMFYALLALVGVVFWGMFYLKILAVLTRNFISWLE